MIVQELRTRETHKVTEIMQQIRILTSWYLITSVFLRVLQLLSLMSYFLRKTLKRCESRVKLCLNCADINQRFYKVSSVVRCCHATLDARMEDYHWAIK